SGEGREPVSLRNPRPARDRRGNVGDLVDHRVCVYHNGTLDGTAGIAIVDVPQQRQRAVIECIVLRRTVTSWTSSAATPPAGRSRCSTARRRGAPVGV